MLDVLLDALLCREYSLEGGGEKCRRAPLPLSDHEYSCVLEFLDAHSLARATVSKQWTKLARSEWLWQQLYASEFRECGVPADGRCWRERFRVESELVFYDLRASEEHAARNAPTAKLLLVGDAGVGKSCLVFRFCRNTLAEYFMSDYVPTIGVDFGRRDTRFGFNKQPLRLLVWDTAGMRRFNSIVMGFRKGADALLLCYNAAAGPESLESVVDKWLEPAVEPREDGQPIVCLVGLQADGDSPPKTTMADAANAVERKLDSKQARIIYAQCSSTNPATVDHAFALVVRALIREKRLKPPSPPPAPIPSPSSFSSRLGIIDEDALRRNLRRATKFRLHHRRYVADPRCSPHYDRACTLL
ncbi:hypothetical protein CTAYLR_009393 [Chrysophaeum taylorii]|uniref:Ras subfamily protein n=1 Tax=Chrysophaeum taylorii TaxID=2483200 RepID=A0AAD7UJW2_9STRA|nr:hypothetical protein CTAYLR_009393 [Chrysophaeum taylorii]